MSQFIYTKQNVLKSKSRQKEAAKRIHLSQNYLQPMDFVRQHQWQSRGGNL